MTQAPIFGGPTKRDLIQQAYGECGSASWEFEIDPEEFAAGCRILDRMMYELRDMNGVDLNYNFPEIGEVGSPEDESGIPYGATSAIVSGLALRIAPTMGKTLSGEAKASLARSYASLLANYVQTPQMELGRNTIRGAGNRYRQWFGPFFVTPTPDNEIIQ